LIRTLLLVDPDHPISSLKDNFDVLYYISLLVWREHTNVTLALSTIRDNLLRSKNMICPFFLFLWME
jgi:hypothetical protein